ncbi:FAD-dependent oxidoreductase [Mycobacterium persicum]|uniref:FAD-dependent oxidoreductase n=1 Tax=Mycobacterium persicum TaxID=1487726 RepID=UPI0031342685
MGNTKQEFSSWRCVMAGVERIDTAVFDSTAAAQRFREDLQELGKAGQTTDITVLTGAALREQVPLASRAVRVGLSVNGQRFIDPARFVAALGRAVLNRGATLRTLEVAEIVNAANGIAVRGRRRAPLMTEAAVIATGAQLRNWPAPGWAYRCGPVPLTCTERGKPGFARFTTCRSGPTSARTRPTTGSPNQAWF